MSDLVQPIVICNEDKYGTLCHELVVRTAASASVSVSKYPHPNWETWLSARFTKTVRRARPRDYDKILLAMEALGYPFSDFSHMGVRVAAFAPLAYEDFPKVLARTQVAGTDYPRTYRWGSVTDEGPVVFINPAIHMTTGKTAAQVAHGVFAWKLRYPDAFEDLPEFSIVEPEDFYDIDAEIEITDAGFTEIDPGTITVKVTSL